MPTDSPDDDGFRTGLEIIRSRDGGEDSTQFCQPCSELAGREVWSPHEMTDTGSYECLQCRIRQVPPEDQATPDDVAEAFADLGEGPDR